MVGFKTIMKKFCDIVTFRWVLWFIIKLRSGKIKNKVVAVVAEANYEYNNAIQNLDDEDPWNINNAFVEKR
jgi:hypothetical protein